MSNHTAAIIKTAYRPIECVKKMAFVKIGLFLAFFIFSGFLLSGQAWAYTDDDLAVYHFDDIAEWGKDSTLNNCHLTCNQYTELDERSKYGSYALNQTSAGHLACETMDNYYSVNLGDTGGLTIGAWLNVELHEPASGPVLFYVENAGNVEVMTQEVRPNPERLSCSLGPVASPTHRVSYAFDYSDQAWHHWVCVIDDTYLRIYVDGVERERDVHNKDLSTITITHHHINVFTSGRNWPQPNNDNNLFDDGFIRAGVLTDDEIVFIYESPSAYTGEFAPPGPPVLPDTYIDIDIPGEAQVIGTNQVNVRGNCQYDGVEIDDGIVSHYTDCIFQMPGPLDKNYLYQQEVLVSGYTTSTGRIAGMVKVFKDDLGEVLPDFRDVRLWRYDGHYEEFEEEINYWFDNNYFYFGAKEEQITGWEYPQYRYYITWYWPYETHATTRLLNPPPITYDFDGTLWPADTITGSYNLSLSNLLPGTYTIKARSWTTIPYLLSDWTADRHFSVEYEQVPPYVLPDLEINYQDHSPFDKPTPFLAGILDSLDGVLSPIAGFVNGFNQFFNTSKATEYAITITDNFKTFISYTKLFDDIIGGYPITAGLLLLIFVYIAIIVVGQVARLISLIKP